MIDIWGGQLPFMCYACKLVGRWQVYLKRDSCGGRARLQLFESIAWDKKHRKKSLGISRACGERKCVLRGIYRVKIFCFKTVLKKIKNVKV